MLEMLQWVMDKFMEIEVAHKTGAEKGFTQKAVPVTDAATESGALTRGSEPHSYHQPDYSDSHSQASP